METTKTLGSFLKAIMTARGLTERTLAQGAGIAQSGLSNVIQERAREPDPRTLRALADYLDIDVFILFRLLGYVPPSTEAYGSYSPLALYVAHRFEELPAERQQVLLHTLEALLEDVEIKKDLQHLREITEKPSVELGGIDSALPELVTQYGRWYLTKGRFTTAGEINPAEDEDVYPGVQFGQLEPGFRRRLVAFLRHTMRQVYSPDLVARDDR